MNKMDYLSLLTCTEKPPRPTEGDWAPGGRFDTDTVTWADRMRCYATGHDVHDWGTMLGWCHRCKHSVWTRDRRSVLSYGRTHRFPPPHEPMADRYS